MCIVLMEVFMWLCPSHSSFSKSKILIPKRNCFHTIDRVCFSLCNIAVVVFVCKQLVFFFHLFAFICNLQGPPGAPGRDGMKVRIFGLFFFLSPFSFLLSSSPHCHRWSSCFYSVPDRTVARGYFFPPWNVNILKCRMKMFKINSILFIMKWSLTGGKSSQGRRQHQNKMPNPFKILLSKN